MTEYSQRKERQLAELEERRRTIEGMGGKENVEKLNSSHVLVVGLGGVGGYAAEQLCRAGIGTLTLVDYDTVQPSNRNRQIIALRSTEGKEKSEVLANRLKDINPDINLKIVKTFLKEEKDFEDLLSVNYDYIVDAIDTLAPKVDLLATAVRKKIPVVSSMGSGGKTDPTQIQIDKIEKSHHCKFAFMVRKYLHRKGIRGGIIVVYSPEPVKKESLIEISGEDNKRSVVGTISYMPSIFGCYCAFIVINKIKKGTKLKPL